MQYTKLGNSGLDVSRICLGCMGFGNKSWADWVLDEEQALPIIKYALDSGINFFDTANIYSFGESERILGKAIKQYAYRDEVVIATKVYFPMTNSKPTPPNSQGLSRKHIFAEVEKSLERLQMDYIDLLIIHRWDYHTPIEETMKALDDLVQAGKVRYIGASSMYAWQFAKAQFVAEKNGWTKFISMQNQHNLLYREEEREMNAFCRDSGVSTTPYAPLAAGRLSREWNEQTLRNQTNQIAKAKFDRTIEQDKVIAERVKMLAEQKGTSRSAVALAWLLNKKPVASVLIGASKTHYIDEAIQAFDVALSPEEMAYLEECYRPHDLLGVVRDPNV